MKRLVGGAVLAAIALALASASLWNDAGAQRAGAATPVKVFQGDGSPAAACGEIAGVGRGGCRPRTPTDARARLTIRSAVGDMPFGHCYLNFKVQIDSSGRTLVSEIAIGSDNPCSDTASCANKQRTDRVPWRGRIVRMPDGRLVHRIAACFETCVGRFAGELEMDLEREGAAWRTSARNATVGDSGFTVDGTWLWRGQPLRIRPPS